MQVHTSTAHIGKFQINPTRWFESRTQKMSENVMFSMKQHLADVLLRLLYDAPALTSNAGDGKKKEADKTDVKQ